MRALRGQLQRLMADEDGATAIEYGLVAALISVALLLVLGTFSGNVLSMFNGVSDQASSALDNINDI